MCSLFFFVLSCQIVMDVMCIVKKTTIIVIFYSTTTYKKHPLKTFDYILDSVCSITQITVGIINYKLGDLL